MLSIIWKDGNIYFLRGGTHLHWKFSGHRSQRIAVLSDKSLYHFLTYKFFVRRFALFLSDRIVEVSFLQFDLCL